jgi:hypothetical protein
MTFGNCSAVSVAFIVLMNLAQTARSPFFPGNRWSIETYHGLLGSVSSRRMPVY